MKKIFREIKNILKWINEFLMLISIWLFGLLVGLKLCNSPIICWAECKLGLNFYLMLGFAGAVVATLFWIIKRFKKIKEWFYKISNWFYRNLALIITLVVFIGLLLLRWHKPYFTLCGFVIWNEDSSYLDLSFYQILTFVAAIATLFWTNKRVKKVDRQYRQTEDNQFLNKINPISLKVVELLNDAKKRKTTKAKNLINYIQASIYSYYKDIGGVARNEKEVRNEKRKELLNFFRMDLVKANLQRANLQGAYLIGANLKGAKLQGANLEEANFFEADVKGTDFTDAENIDLAIDLHMTKHLDQAIGIPKSLRPKLIEDWKTYWDVKGGHPKDKEEWEEDLPF